MQDLYAGPTAAYTGSFHLCTARLNGTGLKLTTEPEMKLWTYIGRGRGRFPRGDTGMHARNWDDATRVCRVNSDSRGPTVHKHADDGYFVGTREICSF